MSNLITLQELSCEDHFTLLLKANATLYNGVSTSVLAFIPYCLKNSFPAIEMGIGEGFRGSGLVKNMHTQLYTLGNNGAITCAPMTFAGREYEFRF